MLDNKLALNDDKTDVIRFSSKFGRGGQPRECDVQVGGIRVHSSPSVRDLGVTFDAFGTMSCHVANVCKSAFFSLWKVGRIRNVLDQGSTEKLVHAFITSRIDYCNSLLFGLCDFEIKNCRLFKTLPHALSLGPKSLTIIPQCWKGCTGCQYKSVLNLKSFV